MSKVNTANQTLTMSEIRAWWADQQRAFLERFAETHDFDFCPLHGFWKLGPKKGGLIVATCPGCTERMPPDSQPPESGEVPAREPWGPAR